MLFSTVIYTCKFHSGLHVRVQIARVAVAYF